VGGCQKDSEDSEEYSVNFVERYNLTRRSATFEEIDSMESRRGAHDVAVLGDKIFAIGGLGLDRDEEGDVHTLSSVEMFDPCEYKKRPKDEIWEMVDNMNEARSHVKAAVIGDAIYAVGGRGFGREILNSVEVYNPDYSLWENCPEMKCRRSDATVFQYDQKLCVIGGEGDSVSSPSMEIYDPLTERWEFHQYPVDLHAKLDVYSACFINSD